MAGRNIRQFIDQESGVRMFNPRAQVTSLGGGEGLQCKLPPRLGVSMGAAVRAAWCLVAAGLPAPGHRERGGRGTHVQLAGSLVERVPQGQVCDRRWAEAPWSSRQKESRWC